MFTIHCMSHRARGGRDFETMPAVLSGMIPTAVEAACGAASFSCTHARTHARSTHGWGRGRPELTEVVISCKEASGRQQHEGNEWKYQTHQ